MEATIRKDDHDIIPISVLELSVRSYNALVRGNIKTIAQLKRMSEEDFYRVRNLGQKSVEEIRKKLAAYLNEYTLAESPVLEPTEPRLSLIEREVLSKVEHIPLYDISLARLTLSPDVEKELRSVGIRSIGDLLENASVVLKQKAVAEVKDRTQRYLAWLSEQDESSWEDEIADRGISPLHRVALEGATIETMIADWFLFLSDRQQFVLRLRFGLSGQLRTLGEVGQELQITRERVRQIEERALNVLRTPARRVYLVPLIEAITQTLGSHAGVMRPQALLGSLTRNYGIKIGSISLFGLFSLVAKVFGQVEISERDGIVFLTSIAPQDILAVQRKLVAILRESDKPLSRRYLLKRFKQTDLYEDEESSGGLSDDFIVACLRSSTQVERDDTGHYALRRSSWRRKSLVVRAMRAIGEPTHYSEITARFNGLVPERQRLSDHNLHAYLGRFPKRFVRVGQGVYGLAEWGLHDDGDLASAAYRVLSNEGQPLHIDTITDRVLETWRAGKNSVYAAVHNDDRFFRAAPATFGLIDWEIERLNEREPVLNICPPPLPDRVGERDTFFESVLVAQEVLKGHPTVSEFLAKMLEWAGTAPEKSAPYIQNILNAYYTVGLIPYILYRYSENSILSPALPDTYDLQQMRSYCLKCMIDRLARMKDFLSILYFRQPCTRDELRDWFYEPDAPIDDVKNRVRLLYNLSMLLREPSGRYRFSPFGKTNLKVFGIDTSSQISSIFVESIELQRVQHDSAIDLIDF